MLRETRASDRRAHPRFAVKLRGILFLDQAEGRISVNCSIADISEGGAQVVLANPAIVPSKVVLFENSKGNIYYCEVRWQNGNNYGLRFIDIVTGAQHRLLMKQVTLKAAE